MREIHLLIQDLESTDATVRNAAAIDLMDLGDERAVAPLLRAITNPENVNHRGTLVYALSAFNCEGFIELMVRLALTGNYEVSGEACSIIEESATSNDCVLRVKAELERYASGTFLAEHHELAWQELVEITGIGASPDA